MLSFIGVSNWYTKSEYCRERWLFSWIVHQYLQVSFRGFRCSSLLQSRKAILCKFSFSQSRWIPKSCADVCGKDNSESAATSRIDAIRKAFTKLAYISSHNSQHFPGYNVLSVEKESCHGPHHFPPLDFEPPGVLNLLPDIVAILRRVEKQGPAY